MRLSKATVRFASVVVAGAMLAACSSSPIGTSAVPGSPSGISQSGHTGGGYSPDGGFHGIPQFPRGKISQEGMLKWWIAGKMPGPASKSVLKQWLKIYENRASFHPQVSRGAASVGMWVNNSAAGYLIGMKTNGKKAVMAINTVSNGCYNSPGMKVDHNQNVWLACGNTASGSVGGVQEYSHTGTLLNTYNGNCPSNIPASECLGAFGEGYDVGTSGGSVILSEEYVEWYYEGTGAGCYSGFCYKDGTGFYVWSSPSSQPYFVNVYYNGAGGLDIYDVGYMDVDGSGNVYAYYYGYDENNGLSGTGIAEFSNLTSPSGPTVTDIVPAGTLPGTNYGYWGGVAVNGSSSKLTVIQSYNQTAYVYGLPFNPSGTPTALGPTQKNLVGCGEPIVGGWNSGEVKIAIGDACGWVDTITSGNDATKAIANINFSGVAAAGYSPSDR